MDENELDELVGKAEANWQAVAQGDPGDNVWGFYSYGDAPAGMGGGVGSFVWFGDKDEMLSFITSTLPFSPPGRASCDWAAVASDVSGIVHALRGGSLSLAEGMCQLNTALKTFSQIEWMGTYEDLKGGDAEYAKVVRRAFFEESAGRSMDDSSLPPPIAPHQDGQFREYLTGWGL